MVRPYHLPNGRIPCLLADRVVVVPEPVLHTDLVGVLPSAGACGSRVTSRRFLMSAENANRSWVRRNLCGIAVSAGGLLCRRARLRIAQWPYRVQGLGS